MRKRVEAIGRLIVACVAAACVALTAAAYAEGLTPMSMSTSSGVEKGDLDGGKYIDLTECPGGKGDVDGDGDIDRIDVELCFEIYMELYTSIDECKRWRADADNDGKITPADARCILQFVEDVHPNCLDILYPTATPTPASEPTVEPTATVGPVEVTPTPTPTAAPLNYLELEVTEEKAVLGGTVTLEWAADPDRIWELMGRPVGIYFAAAKGQEETDRPATVAEALRNERMYLFGTERGMLEASLLDPSHIPATWDAVTFPLADGATSGRMTFPVPTDPSFAGPWVFEAAFVEPGTGGFVNPERPVEISNAVEVR